MEQLNVIRERKKEGRNQGGFWPKDQNRAAGARFWGHHQKWHPGGMEGGGGGPLIRKGGGDGGRWWGGEYKEVVVGGWWVRKLRGRGGGWGQKPETERLWLGFRRAV